MGDLQAALLGSLRQRHGRAMFIQELRACLAGAAVSESRFEEGLAALEDAGSIIVRPQFCGDPHLVDADLRLAALIEAAPETDPQARAIAAIDAAWQRWLGDYLANHRCT